MNGKSIIKVVGLRVSANPSEEMQNTLKGVKEWAENYKFKYYEFNDDYAN